MDQIDELLTRGVANIVPGKDQLEKLLRSGKKLNVYLGIDPTATHIHIGHAVPLRKLQSFVELGHNVTFLIGDFTALIGNTSDKESERPILSYEQIQENFKTYKQQAEKILDFSKLELHYNNEWLSKLTFPEIVKLIQHFSLNDFISREMIKKRLTNEGRVRLDETIYPVMQGYDCYHLDADIQLGGTDETFNMQAGRILQKDLRNKDAYFITNSFIEGTDGRKMSKSWGNAIWLDDEPNDMFGKVMSVKDELIVQYFTLATNLQLETVSEKEKRIKSGENPMKLKIELAWQIVSDLHSSKEADKARENFENTFQKGNLDETDMIEMKANGMLLDSLLESKLISSKSEGKRLLDQKAIEKDGEVITSDSKVTPGIYKIGKKKFLKIT